MDFSGEKKCNFSVEYGRAVVLFIQSSILLFCHEEIHNAFTVLVNCSVSDQK